MYFRYHAGHEHIRAAGDMCDHVVGMREGVGGDTLLADGYRKDGIHSRTFHFACRSQFAYLRFGNGEAHIKARDVEDRTEFRSGNDRLTLLNRQSVHYAVAGRRE